MTLDNQDSQDQSSNNTLFKLPIEYLDTKRVLDNHIIEDLELSQKQLDVNSPQDSSNLTDHTRSHDGLLNEIYQPKSIIAKEYLYKQSQFYTSDKHFLKDTQKILKKWKILSNDVRDKQTNCFDKTYNLWKTMKEDTTFIEKYFYVDIERFSFLNKSSLFLQILSIYNLFSPVLSLLLPVILMIVPFFMLKINGVDLTIESYIKVLSNLLSKHALGNIFTVMREASWEKRVYGIISILFYMFQIYQNTLTCYRFYKNFSTIHSEIIVIRDYLKETIINMESLENIISKHKSYIEFYNDVKNKRIAIINVLSELERIENISSVKTLYNNLYQTGYILKWYYDLHIDNDIDDLINYSHGLNAYIEHMSSLSNSIHKKVLHKCTFSKKTTKLYDCFFPCQENLTQDTTTVKNTINIDKNMIITGPNAAGKTTILKSALFNIIFTQQHGFGYYSKAQLDPYDYIHCYINIPDTSGRDSLFQAEARRCKEIISSIKKKQRHFCIFDELYSGTNPHEAVASAYGLIQYMIELGNIDFILTTHLTELCNLLDNDIHNRHMDVNCKNKYDFTYTYKLCDGISTVKGGLKVLYDLEYPEYILEKTNSLLNST
tara:strand:+ start:1863 stop:3671 length:1809 start_codon:yes stop_codon:yes gene_type:complete